jgi:hypothetical protein
VTTSRQRSPVPPRHGHNESRLKQVSINVLARRQARAGTEHLVDASCAMAERATHRNVTATPRTLAVRPTRDAIVAAMAAVAPLGWRLGVEEERFLVVGGRASTTSEFAALIEELALWGGYALAEISDRRAAARARRECVGRGHREARLLHAPVRGGLLL